MVCIAPKVSGIRYIQVCKIKHDNIKNNPNANCFVYPAKHYKVNIFNNQNRFKNELLLVQLLLYNGYNVRDRGYFTIFLVFVFKKNNNAFCIEVNNILQLHISLIV